MCAVRDGADHFPLTRRQLVEQDEIPTIQTMGAVHARLTTTNTRRRHPLADGPLFYEQRVLMNRFDEVLAGKGEVAAADVSAETVLERKGSWLEELIAEANAHYDSIQPVEVDVMLGEMKAKLLVPFIRPNVFSELADHYPPRPGVAADSALWFNISGVTRAYPGVVLVTDDGDDDLFRLREREATYVWAELYEALSPEDAQNVRMAVWALHVWEPQQRQLAASKKKVAAHG